MEMALTSSAAPGDVDALVKQVKDAAKSAGLPADTIESWLKSKAEDGKINAEETVRVDTNIDYGSRLIDIGTSAQVQAQDCCKVDSRRAERVGRISQAIQPFHRWPAR